MIIYESFVSSLTSHLAVAQPGCVLHHVLTEVGEGRAIKAFMKKRTDGICSQHSLNAVSSSLSADVYGLWQMN